jgi:hypothetical protein
MAERVSDLGGPDTLSEGQRQLARRAMMLATQCEIMEGEAVAGKGNGVLRATLAMPRDSLSTQARFPRNVMLGLFSLGGRCRSRSVAV